MPVDAKFTPPAKPAPFVPNFKFPESRALGEALLGNLTANMSDPDAANARRDARDIAMAAEAGTAPGGTTPGVNRAPA